MRLRRLRWGLVGALGCAVAVPAQGRVGSDEDRAREIEKQVTQALREGRKLDAAEGYREAWQIYKNPWYMCNIGGLETEMGRAREAAESLSACWRLLGPEDKKLVGPKVERMLNDARAKVGELTIEANVPGAEVVVDGKVSGTLPLKDPLFVEPGSHVVEVRAPGYQSDLRIAVLRAGASMIIPMRLEPMRVEVAPAPAERAPVEPKPSEGVKSPVPAPLPVRSSPSPSVKAPAPISMPKAGAEPERAPVRAAVIFTGFGLGVAGAAVGAAGFMAAGAARDEAKALTQAPTPNSNQCPGDTNDPCWAVYNAMDKAVGLTALGVAGITVAALGGSLLVYEFVRSAPEGRTAGARVSVMAAPGGGALQITGSF